MSEQKKKIILAIALASILIILLGAVSLTFFPSKQAPASTAAKSAPMIPGPATGPMTIEVPLSSTVEINSSIGFTSSLVAGAANLPPILPPDLNTSTLTGETSPLLVLAPGGAGSVPFLVYSTNSNETVSVSLNVDLTSPPDVNTVAFSVSPSSFNISPGEKVQAVLTVTANQDTPAAFYQPYVDVQTNSSDVLETQISMPDLLVSSVTPTCLFLVNEQQILQGVVSAPAPSSLPVYNTSVASPPVTVSPPLSPSTPVPSLLVVPTFNLTQGQTATVMYACVTQYSLSLNVTAPSGFTYEFSPNPTNVIFSNTTAQMYALTVTADANVGSGTYEVNATGTLGSTQFNAPFYISLS